MASAAANLAIETAEERGAARRHLRLALASETVAGATVLRNISRTGVMIESPTALAEGEQVDIVFPELGPRALTVQWKDGALYGCRFEAPISAAAISAALLRADPLQGGSSDPAVAAYEDHELDEVYSLPTRMRIFVGLTVLSWGVVIGAVAAVL